jgi:hypothetical protein
MVRNNENNYLTFFLSSSPVTRNFTFKVDKWDDQGLEPQFPTYIM